MHNVVHHTLPLADVSVSCFCLISAVQYLTHIQQALCRAQIAENT